MDSVSGRGTNAVEMGNKSSVNGGVSEMAFHCVEFALGIAFPFIEFNSLALYRLEFALMCSIPIDVSDNSRILEIYNGVVDEKAGGGGWMENVEVIVLDPQVIEIGSRVCLGMEGDGVLSIATLASSYKVSVDPYLSKGNIACHLILTILIEEDEGVLSRITMIVLTPPVSWMIRVTELFSKLGNVGDGARRRRQ